MLEFHYKMDAIIFHWQKLMQCQIIAVCSHAHNGEVLFSHIMHYFHVIATNLKASLQVVNIVLNKAYLSVSYDIVGC